MKVSQYTTICVLYWQSKESLREFLRNHMLFQISGHVILLKCTSASEIYTLKLCQKAQST